MMYLANAMPDWDRFAEVLENLPNENLDNIVRDLDELKERWDNSLSFGGSLSKYYLDGRLDVLVRCGVRGAEDKYVIFRADDKVPDIRGSDLSKNTLNILDKTDWCSGRGAYHCQCLVFINDVQTMQQTKIVVPSLAWVQSADNISDILSGALYFSDRTGWQTVGLGEDRESGIVIGDGAIDTNRSKNQVVERRPEIVDAIADDQAPLQRNFGLDRLASAISVVIDDKQVRATLRNGANALAEIVDVMYGPFDLGPSTSNRRRTSHGRTS